MLKLIIIFITFLFFTVDANATKTKRLAKGLASTLEDSTSLKTNKEVIKLSFGMGPMATMGYNGCNFYLGSFIRIRNNTYGGLETGFNIRAAGADAALAIPILASGYVAFPYEYISPYVGLSAGIWLNVSNDDTSFAMFFKPGVTFNMSEKVDIDVEARFGGLDGIFIINPRVALAVKL